MDVENPFANLPELETPRLLLRRIAMDDAQDMFEYARDPEVSRYVGWSTHYSLDDSYAYINMLLDGYARGEPMPWGIEHKADHKMIGTCGLFGWSRPMRRAEVGYVINRDYWGHGYALEAATAVLDWGFKTVGLNRIQAICNVPNTASSRVMEKLGMSFEGIMRGYSFKGGVSADMKLYAILRGEWLSRTS